MSSEPTRAYRIAVRPVPNNQARYLWAIYGTQTLFYEASQTEYRSIEQALADANARLSELE